jgi:hypothetical protein
MFDRCLTSFRPVSGGLTLPTHAAMIDSIEVRAMPDVSLRRIWSKTGQKLVKNWSKTSRNLPGVSLRRIGRKLDWPTLTSI